MIEQAWRGWQAASIHRIVETKIQQLDGPANAHHAD
jgi:hypothetical protein